MEQSSAGRLNAIVAMIRVEDVERSAAWDGPGSIVQQVLFYSYTHDLPFVRGTLLAHGIPVSEITSPEYLPSGECQVRDPDGYTVMIAQSGPDTP